MVNLRHIDDTLDDIKKIIFYYADSIDYSDFIEKLEHILDILELEKSGADEEKLNTISLLECRARDYLAKARTFQIRYLNQENENA